MKTKTAILLACLPLAILLSSCAKEQIIDRNKQPSNATVESSANFVNIDMVRSYADRHQPKTKVGGRVECSIEPFVGTEGDTLMYIVNYGAGEGWKILSADSRTPAVIAEGAEGSFSMEQGGGIQVWMDLLRKDMEAIRGSSDDELTFSAEEISVNKSLWKVGGDAPRALDDPQVPVTGWWAVRTTSETLVSDSLNHMTPHWDQDSPYNAYCPLKSDGSGNRAPAGCVAIAGANVLYYLHNKLGVPASMVSAGYCYGDIDNFSSSFTNPTDSAWDSMSSESQPVNADAEALMIGFVGNIVGMHYHNSYSWAIPAHLRTQLCSFYGISCSGGNYNENIVKANLENDLPVIVTATNLLIPADFDIHCFVIDGYKKTYTKYTHYHYWYVEDGGIDLNPGEHMPYYTYTYTTPEISAIKINWGWKSQWGSSHINDGWYSLTANWYVQNGSYYSYNYNVSMSYGFSI